MTMITRTQGAVRKFRMSEVASYALLRFDAMRESRRTMKDLTVMDEHILRDIGLTRTDVMRAEVAELGVDRMEILRLARARHIV